MVSELLRGYLHVLALIFVFIILFLKIHIMTRCGHASVGRVHTYACMCVSTKSCHYLVYFKTKVRR
uniref:Uncharacterized protein n=1 Tax=Anguilla anguilla TaxID=7936 RepID=A0A0E9UVR8_ANGAN